MLINLAGMLIMRILSSFKVAHTLQLLCKGLNVHGLNVRIKFRFQSQELMLR